MNDSATRPRKSGDLLLLLHPGHLAISADAYMGNEAAIKARETIIHELEAWQGHMLIVDSTVSHELEMYPHVKEKIAETKTRLEQSGYEVMQTFACDCSYKWEPLVLEALDDMAVLPQVKIFITGAFVTLNNEEGGINAVSKLIQDRGAEVAVMSSAAAYNTDE